jgi:hypothetical protein
MARLRWLWILSLLCLLPTGCENKPKKPDATKGAVAGIVLCADTGKPARFATVTLSAAPKANTQAGANKADENSELGNPLPATETAITGLDGRFRIEAVEPGRYYAFATQEGYLDPLTGLDFARLTALGSDKERNLDAIDQWKDHLVELTASVHRTTEVSVQMERAAEIAGTVTYDDGSPAIGMHFQLLRKTEKSGLTEVGLALFDGWSTRAVSDSHGHFSVTNLPAGEYAVCALMPSDSQDSAACVCLGNTFRKKDAATLKVQAGETASGADIVIPLSGLHTVAGTVTALADGHALGRGTVRLLYAEDREKARETSILDDGSFSLQYVAEGKYILAVSGAQDAEQKAAEPGSDNSPAPASKPAPAAASYADKEIPLIVLGEMDDIQIPLAATPQDKPQSQ